MSKPTRELTSCISARSAAASAEWDGTSSSPLLMARVSSTASPARRAAASASCSESSASAGATADHRGPARSTSARASVSVSPTARASARDRSAQSTASVDRRLIMWTWATATTRRRPAAGGRRATTRAPRARRAGDGCGLVVELLVQPGRRSAGRRCGRATSTATFDQRDRRLQRLGAEVQAPRRLGRHRQQLGVVRRLGQAPRRRGAGPRTSGPSPGTAPRPGGRSPAPRRGGRRPGRGTRARRGRASGARRTASKQRSCSRRRSRPSSWWTMASATRAWENQNWSSLTSTTTPASTSERRSSMRSASDASVTISSASNDADRPYTASASTTRPAAVVEAGDLLAHGLLQRPRQLGVEQVGDTIGRGPTTRISSSTTNGMPAAAPVQRLDERRRRLAAGGREIAATIAPTSVRSSRSRRTCSTACRRSSRSTSSPPGWPRDRSFGRYVAMITRFGHGCWAMRSMRLALAASIQWRSSTTSTTGPLATAAATRSNTAAATSSSAPPVPTSVATASSGRPIEPGWAVTVTRRHAGPAGTRPARATRRVLPMPASPDTRATVGWSPVITSAASTMPARRANGRARPTITGLIPTRPLTALDPLTTLDARSPSVDSRPQCGRESGGRPVRRHAGRDRRGRAPPGEVGGGRSVRVA